MQRLKKSPTKQSPSRARSVRRSANRKRSEDQYDNRIMDQRLRRNKNRGIPLDQVLEEFGYVRVER